MKNDAAHVVDMIQACGHIADFLADVAQERFVDNAMLQSAVIRQLEIIGEVARRLSREYRDRRKAVPWKQIIGMRDRLIHGYDDIHLHVVWKVASEEVPMLLKQLESDSRFDEIGSD